MGCAVDDNFWRPFERKGRWSLSTGKSRVAPRSLRRQVVTEGGPHHVVNCGGRPSGAAPGVRGEIGILHGLAAASALSFVEVVPVASAQLLYCARIRIAVRRYY